MEPSGQGLPSETRAQLGLSAHLATEEGQLGSTGRGGESEGISAER